MKGFKKAWVTHCLDEINIICPHMEYELVVKIRGTKTRSSKKEMCEERKEEIMKYATMKKEINI